MIKKIIPTIALLILAGMIIFMGYYFYFNHYTKSVESGFAMTKKLCESDGGEWVVGWKITNEGDQSLNTCECRGWLIPSKMSPWIGEGTMKKCP